METYTYYSQMTSIPDVDTQIIQDVMLDMPNFFITSVNLVNSLTELGNTISLYSIDRSSRNDPEATKFYIIKELILPIGATLLLTEKDFPSFNRKSRLLYLHINSELEPQGTVDIDMTFTSSKI